MSLIDLARDFMCGASYRVNPDWRNSMDRVVEILTTATTRLKWRVGSKFEAIQQAGELLARAGYVAPDYVDGMLLREEMLSTYLGNGIAIPHGRRQDLRWVYHSGVSVLQLEQGVEWDAGEKARLVIGLAAASNELGPILTNLVDVLKETDTVLHLMNAKDPGVIVERLTRAVQE